MLNVSSPKKLGGKRGPKPSSLASLSGLSGREDPHSLPHPHDHTRTPRSPQPLTPPSSAPLPHTQQPSWLTTSSPEPMLADTYEEAKYNQYSIDVETLLTTGKFNGQHMSEWRPGGGIGGGAVDTLQAQLCTVAQVTPNRKVSKCRWLPSV